MFKKILIANRGDQPHRGAAPQPLKAGANGVARAACAGDGTAEARYV